MIDKYIYKSYINNSSDIQAFLNDKLFDKEIYLLNNRYIKVTSHLIHKENYITDYEQLIFNIDNYISFIKSFININEIKLRYILSNTFNNKYCYVLISDKYYYQNIDYYNNQFIKIFMYKYNVNIKILQKHLKINKLSFTELCHYINSNKQAHILFEDINEKNIFFYIRLIKSIN